MDAQINREEDPVRKVLNPSPQSRNFEHTRENREHSASENRFLPMITSGVRRDDPRNRRPDYFSLVAQPLLIVPDTLEHQLASNAYP